MTRTWALKYAKKPPHVHALTSNVLSNVSFGFAKHTVRFECVCTNPRTQVMEPSTLTKARVRAQWSGTYAVIYLSESYVLRWT